MRNSAIKLFLSWTVSRAGFANVTLVPSITTGSRMRAFLCLKQISIAALLALSLCWGNSVQAQWNPTSDPIGAWAYSTLPSPYTYPPGHLYYPFDVSEFDGAVFQFYVLENTPSGFGPVYSDPNPKFHILSTYVYVKEDTTLPISFGGDDGSSLFIDGAFLGGHGFDEPPIYNGAWNDPNRQAIGLTIRQPDENFDRHYVEVNLKAGSNFLTLGAHNSIGGYAWDLRVEEYANPHRIKDDPNVLTISAEPLNANEELAKLAYQIGNLVTAGDIAPELEKSLLVKVYAAKADLYRGNYNAETTAANTLNALMNQIEAQSGKKITNSKAAALLKQANLVIVLLSE